MLQSKYRTMLFVLFNNKLITNNHYEVIIQNEVIKNTLRPIEKHSSKTLNKLSDLAFIIFRKYKIFFLIQK